LEARYWGDIYAQRSANMPRANRHYLPGQLWHITHRCHERSFLLKFARDRRAYRRWLFEARKRFGLCVLDYVVTCNHIHLLVRDTEEGVVARSVQLAAGCTAQQFNSRKGRRGAFWEDRYHATAVESGEHLHRCLVYIDLNMVRAGVVGHPAAWADGGYREIQDPPQRYALIALGELSALCGFSSVSDFQRAHRRWIGEALVRAPVGREERWSTAIAVGSQAFVEKLKQALGISVRHRHVDDADGMYVLREPSGAYRFGLDAEDEEVASECEPARPEISVDTAH
jgi:putative transposase